MGLHAWVYKTDQFRDTLSKSSELTQITVINVPGPFKPAGDAPAYELVEHPAGPAYGPILVPADHDGHTMASGNFAASSDSRWGEAVERAGGHRFQGAVAIHDRIEPAQLTEQMSRFD